MFAQKRLPFPPPRNLICADYREHATAAKSAVEGARVVALGALNRLKCVAPLDHVELWAVGIVPDMSTFVRLEELYGDAEGALHRDFELPGVQGGKVVRGP